VSSSADISSSLVRRAFAIEFIRVNLRIVGPFTLAQLISMSLIIAGVILLLRPGTTIVRNR
jgi:hypothetical protein